MSTETIYLNNRNSLDPIDVFTPIEKWLTFVGMWPSDNPPVTNKIIGYAVVVIPQIIFTVVLLVRVYTDKGDLLAFGQSSACTTTMFMYVIKTLAIIYNKEEFLHLMIHLRDTTKYSFPSPVEKHMESAIIFSNAITKVFTYFICFFLFITFTYPLYQYNPEEPLPFPFPFDLRDKTVAVVCLYISQIAILTPGAFTYLYLDFVIYICIILARAQFKILKDSLTNAINVDSVGNLEQDTAEFGNLDQEINNKLAYCVKYHSDILKYVSSVQATFAAHFLGQIVTNLYLICIIGFCIATVKEVNGIFVFLVGFLFIIMGQFALMCAAANEIIIESSQVGETCYLANWSKCGPKVRKTLFIIMERSKRPAMLAAAYFVPLSLMTFMSVLKSAASYFTVLRAVYGNDNK